MNWIRFCIAESPRAALAAGKAVFLVGALMIVAAVFARVALIGLNAERAKAKLPAVAKLAEVYPQYPTWLVPESPAGYLLAAILVLAGMYLVAQAGEALKRR
jgi:hypothetical protein